MRFWRGFIRTCFVFCLILSSRDIFAYYTPAPMISLTGADGGVHFDVTDDIFDSASSVGGPILVTSSRTFSGAFYLSGAGWVDFSTGAYRVDLDCGGASLSLLTSPCTLSGVAYSEMIGDVVFDREVQYDPYKGTLSGSISTFLGGYSFSGIYLPLLPAFFSEGTGSVAHHSTLLTISGGAERYGDGPWQIYFDESMTSDSVAYDLSTLSSVDLSLAGFYRVRVIDPSGSITEFDYTSRAGLPSPILTPGNYRHRIFCSVHPTSMYCPDGDILMATRLIADSGPKVGNGADFYDFSLELRDMYGNAVEDGTIRVEYTAPLRNVQVDMMEYAGDLSMSGFSLITRGALMNNYDDTLTTLDTIPLGGFDYSIASMAPTSSTDTVFLSGVIYTDETGTSYDIALGAWRTPLEFRPWYTSTLRSDTIIIGEESGFYTDFLSQTPAVVPESPVGIYHLDIGDNIVSSYRAFSGEGTIACTKYYGELPTDAICSWMRSPDTVVIATDGLTFSGIYQPSGGYDPPPETISYRSYIRYQTGGVAVVYETGRGDYGLSVAGKSYMKILGQQNISLSNGISLKNDGDIWNTLRKNIALLSRNRESPTDYNDVDYLISRSDMTISDSDLDGKRAIIVVGGDITIDTDITSRDTPVAIIALSDIDGNGGDIIIAPGVSDIVSSLFAQKSVHSSGDRQLYIRGSVISHNTVSKTECPYYVSGPCMPDDYNLQYIRKGYRDLADKTGKTASSPRALEYGDISLIIEYDGRIMLDPPSVLGR